MQNVKGEWHEINRDERRGRTSVTDQLRYSKSPGKLKRDWREINKDERRGRIRATDQLKYSQSPEKSKERVARYQ